MPDVKRDSAALGVAVVALVAKGHVVNHVGTHSTGNWVVTTVVLVVVLGGYWLYRRRIRS